MRPIILVLLIVAFPSLSHGKNPCALTALDIVENLGLSFHEFDQTFGQGSRKWFEKGCYLESGYLSDIYHLHHLDKLEPWQDGILYFHSGQSYAFANLYPLAIERFSKSFDPLEPEDPNFPWNAYVRATIAFLQKDLPTIKAQLKIMETKENPNNLKIVRRFTRCLESPYSDAYSGSGTCKQAPSKNQSE